MKTRKVLAVAMILMLGSYVAMAQHAGHGSHGSSNTGGFGHMGHDRAMADLQRAMMIQGTEEQRLQFNNYTESAETLRSQAEAIASANADSKPEYLRAEKDQAQSALEAMERSYQAFATGLTGEQRKVVKKQLGQMDKARAELASSLQKLGGELARSALDTKRISGYGKKLQKAIGQWQNNQRELGTKLSLTS